MAVKPTLKMTARMTRRLTGRIRTLFSSAVLGLFLLAPKRYLMKRGRAMASKRRQRAVIIVSYTPFMSCADSCLISVANPITLTKSTKIYPPTNNMTKVNPHDIGMQQQQCGSLGCEYIGWGSPSSSSSTISSISFSNTTFCTAGEAASKELSIGLLRI